MNFVRGWSIRMLPVLLAMLAPVPLLAEETVAVTPADPSEIRTLDEVVVTGNLHSLTEARKAVIAAEDRFYARYNELSKGSAMDLVCRVVAPTGSRLTRRNCQPRMVDDLARNEALKFVGVAAGTVKLAPPPDMKAQLMARTLQLLANDPELLRALLERARLQQFYEDLLARKFEDHLVVRD
jgi:hypothetical protein